VKEYDDEAELTRFVWNHYARLLTPVEAKVSLAVVAEEKAAVGHQAFAKFLRKRHGLDDDAVVLAQLADGKEAFRQRTTRRILREHGHEVFINRCDRCRRIVQTPKARQCLWCGFDWHKGIPGRSETRLGVVSPY
jgi:hypothetical protein